MPGFEYPKVELPEYKIHDPQGEYAKGLVQTTPGTVKDAPEVDKKGVYTPPQMEKARAAEKVRRGPAKVRNLSERIM